MPVLLFLHRSVSRWRTCRAAAHALDVEQARYDEGVDTAYDLIQYDRNLAQAESAEVTALGVYGKSKSALERAVGLTLKNNNVDIGEAYEGKVSRPPSTFPTK
jgi:outer membrane protein TolC